MRSKCSYSGNGWSYNLRSSENIDSDDDNEYRTLSQPAEDVAIGDPTSELDISSRTDAADYKPNPWTIAKHIVGSGNCLAALTKPRHSVFGRNGHSQPELLKKGTKLPHVPAIPGENVLINTPTIAVSIQPVNSFQTPCFPRHELGMGENDILKRDTTHLPDPQYALQSVSPCSAPPQPVLKRKLPAQTEDCKGPKQPPAAKDNPSRHDVPTTSESPRLCPTGLDLNIKPVVEAPDTYAADSIWSTLPSMKKRKVGIKNDAPFVLSRQFRLPLGFPTTHRSSVQHAVDAKDKSRTIKYLPPPANRALGPDPGAQVTTYEPRGLGDAHNARVAILQPAVASRIQPPARTRYGLPSPPTSDPPAVPGIESALEQYSDDTPYMRISDDFEGEARSKYVGMRQRIAEVRLPARN
ncbi:uncharacterized protein FIBRA_08233 [Fibroporia radiculosa]|uniref:Uncharacterized protein n=1 Tax=Fibroporia radiculosa TaxID=599839 RepID=J4I2E5_9APHY|nr:uncharacterized protein FIBRA_08233 [Fibroporia radiculosa]CCM05992.1 predicted protein [Fibroporia radiculosa]